MTNPGIREVLLRYRRGSADENDPEVRTALRSAETDPGLARWVAEHQEFHTALRHHLRNITPPAALKEQIVSECPIALPPPATVRRREWVLASLSVVAVLIGLVLWLQPQREERFETFRSRMVRIAQRGYSMQLVSSDAAEIQRYLAGRGVTSSWVESPGLKGRTLLGCAVLSWQNRPAAMICYGQEDQPDVWLFVVDSAAFPDAPREEVSAVINRLPTVSWQQAGTTYLLAGRLDPATLQQLAPATKHRG